MARLDRLHVKVQYVMKPLRMIAIISTNLPTLFPRNLLRGLRVPSTLMWCSGARNRGERPHLCQHPFTRLEMDDRGSIIPYRFQRCLSMNPPTLLFNDLAAWLEGAIYSPQCGVRVRRRQAGDPCLVAVSIPQAYPCHSPKLTSRAWVR